MKLSTLFCLFGVIFSIVFATPLRLRNKGNEKDDLTINLPKFNLKNLSSEQQIVVKELKSFADKYRHKAEDVKRMKGGSQKVKAAKQFGSDFQKEKSLLEGKVKALSAPKRRNGGILYTDGSLMGKLQDFMKAVNELPVRVHCLIQDCRGLIPSTIPDVTLPTLSTSSTETTEDMEPTTDPWN